MKSAYFVEPRKMEVREFPKPEIENSTDAIVRVVRACVCGSDLWWYRGIGHREPGGVGHEAIGVVDSIGSEVIDLKVGDFVIVPFTHGCGKCKVCLEGYEGNCPNSKDAVNGFYQGEYYRAIFADNTLVKIPGKPSDYSEDMLANFTTLADVMPTGYHAAVNANVKNGDTVVVYGDGAVGLCAVIACKLLGATRIIAMSRHQDRQKLALEFGATDIIAERGAEAVAKIIELTNGLGADAALECVGMKESIESAFQSVRPGGHIGRVGIPHDVDYNEWVDKVLFWKNIHLGGGIASPTFHNRVLLPAVLSGAINPGKVFTKSYTLDEIQSAYADMDERKTIKSLLKISD
ncbi:MAG TPA: zinc-dependent alcohol dehydrogenase family protein [Lactovum miscens]|uniref:zinc-dependent alcohol dehydrogenase family protein n=1 Tax=Lactovum miscens TaxID=190387 RepID=UPI002ED9AA49